jgi:hypothetical protein
VCAEKIKEEKRGEERRREEKRGKERGESVCRRSLIPHGNARK